MRINVFKTAEPKRFNYQPLYWDPEKEEREARYRRALEEVGADVPEIKRTGATITRGSFRKYRSNTKSKAHRDSNRRLVFILAALIILAYLLFYR